MNYRVLKFKQKLSLYLLLGVSVLLPHEAWASGECLNSPTIENPQVRNLTENLVAPVTRAAQLPPVQVSRPSVHHSITTTRLQNGDIILSEPLPCSGILEAARGLLRWSFVNRHSSQARFREPSLNLTDERYIESLISRSESRCTMNVTSILPERMRRVIALGLRDGPNCWNTALYTVGLVPTISYSAPEELNFWLNSPYCRALETGENAEPGDIHAIRSIFGPGRAPIESHAYIHLFRGTVFGKDSWAGTDASGISSDEEAFDSFDVSRGFENMRVNNRNELSPSPDAARFSQAFRCRAPRVVAQGQDVGAHEVTSRIGTAIESHLLGNSTLTESQLADFQQSLNQVRAQTSSNTSSFVGRADFYRAGSLLEQINMIRHPWTDK